jgi:hypothetical protein
MTEHSCRWTDVVDGLRQRGIAARLDTRSPGWWYLVAPTEDPADSVVIGSHLRGDKFPFEASIDLHDGPGDFFIVYRHIHEPLSASADFYTETNDLDELAGAIRTAYTAPTKDLR